MRKALLLLVLVSAACSKDPPARTESTSSTATVTSAAIAVSAPPATTPAASAAPPAVAPDTVSLQEQTTAATVDKWTLAAQGLPALSDDGKRVAYVINEQDGMRGYANHKLFVKLVASDAIDKSVAIFDADQLDKADRAKTLDDARKKVTAAVATARTTLSGKWTPMTAATGAREKAYTSGELTMELNKALRFTVTDKSGKKLVDLDAKGWKKAGSAPCAFSPVIAGAAVQPDKKVVAVTIAHVVTSGGDACNLSDEVHVIAWK